MPGEGRIWFEADIVSFKLRFLLSENKRLVFQTFHTEPKILKKWAPKVRLLSEKVRDQRDVPKCLALSASTDLILNNILLHKEFY